VVTLPYMVFLIQRIINRHLFLIDFVCDRALVECFYLLCRLLADFDEIVLYHFLVHRHGAVLLYYKLVCSLLLLL